MQETLSIAARIDAILFSGRGADGTLGVEAQTLSIPSGQFVRIAAPVRDGREPMHSTHRAVWRGFESFDTQPSPVNPRDQKVVSVFVVAVEAVYVAANGLGGFVRAAGSEDKEDSASDPSLVALGDAKRIRAALTFPGLFQESGDVPAIVDVSPQGDAVVIYQDNAVVARQLFRVKTWGLRVYQP